MTYLDTGCLLKLYYPEPNSAAIVAAVIGKVIALTSLHELELTNALQLKRFRGEATAEQANAAADLVRADLMTAKFRRPHVDWAAALRESVEMAQWHAAEHGCRSLDVLHCAVALAVNADEFISTDARQIGLANAVGLPVFPL